MQLQEKNWYTLPSLHTHTHRETRASNAYNLEHMRRPAYKYVVKSNTVKAINSKIKNQVIPILPTKRRRWCFSLRGFREESRVIKFPKIRPWKPSTTITFLSREEEQVKKKSKPRKDKIETADKEEICRKEFFLEALDRSQTSKSIRARWLLYCGQTWTAKWNSLNRNLIIKR